MKKGGISGEALRQYVSKIERLEEEKKNISDDIRDIYAEAKANGFDPKVMRMLIRLRKMKPHERDEQESILDIYKHAVGMTFGGDEEEEAA